MCEALMTFKFDLKKDYELLLLPLKLSCNNGSKYSLNLASLTKCMNEGVKNEIRTIQEGILLTAFHALTLR